MAKIPLRLRDPKKSEPHESVHAMVHSQPNHPRTGDPVARSNAHSRTTPRPMRGYNTPSWRNSVTRPAAHAGPTMCMRPDTANAPMTAPGRPRSAPPGRAPNTTKKCRKNWCQRTPQKSRTDVAIHGRQKNGGQCVAGWRRRIRPINIATWYIRSNCAYIHRPRTNVASGAEDLRSSKKGRPVSMRLLPPVSSMEGTHQMQDVLCGVEKREFQECFSQDGRNRRWRGAPVGKRTG
jgi:hypothetical protein